MSNKNRLHRLSRGVMTLAPDTEVIHTAMEVFRETGRLPQDSKLARAVTEWAETGEGPSDEGQSALVRLIVTSGLPDQQPLPPDPVMRGLYEDAVFGEWPENLLARSILCILARVGHDPAQPLWRQNGWPVPERTCRSMTLTLLGYPAKFVLAEHRRRAVALGKNLAAFSSAHLTSPAGCDRFLAAMSSFCEGGPLPGEAGIADAILWNEELAAYCRMWETGEDHTDLIGALRDYWQAPTGKRPVALARVHTAIRTGPGPRDPAHPGPKARLKEVLVIFIKDAMDVAEQMA